MTSKLTALALCVTLLATATAAQQPGADINSRVRKEGTDNSQILRTMHFLDRRLWSAADWIAQSQSRRRVGGQADDGVGL